jgi:hypothetical protein
MPATTEKIVFSADIIELLKYTNHCFANAGNDKR